MLCHKHMKLVEKAIKALCILLLVAINIACSPSSDVSLSDPEPEDTQPPVIQDVEPEGDDVNYEVDEPIRIEFNETLHLPSLYEQDGINLYSSHQQEDATVTLYSRPTQIIPTVEINRGQKLNEATGVISDENVTVAYIVPDMGRLALNNQYTLVVGSDIRDTVEDDLDTEQDERNYFKGPSDITFQTQQGTWNNLELLEIVNETEVEPLYTEDNSQTVIDSNSEGDLFYARVNDGTKIYTSFLSHYSNNFLNLDFEEVENHCLSLDTILTDTACVNSQLVHTSTTGTIEQLELNVADELSLLTWVQPAAIGAGRALWLSVMNNGVWSTPQIINLVFQNDTDIDVNLYSVSLNENGAAAIAWRSTLNDVERVRAITLTTDQLKSVDLSVSPLEILDKSVVNNFNVRRLSSLWRNTESGAVIWSQTEGDVYRIFERSFKLNSEGTPSYVWSAAKNVDKYSNLPTGTDGNVVDFKTRADSKGDIHAVWKKFDGRLDSLWYAKRTQGLWSTAKRIERNQASSVSAFDFSIDGLDNVMVTWVQALEPEGQTSLFYKRFHPGVTTEVFNEITIAPNVSTINLVLDYEGNGHLFWLEKDGRSDSLKNSFYSRLSRKWSSTSELDSTASFGAIESFNTAKLFKDGRVFALWNKVEFSEATTRFYIYE